MTIQGKQHPDRCAPTPLARGELKNSPSSLKGWQPQADGVDVYHINHHTIQKKFTPNLPRNQNLKNKATALRKAGVLSEVLFWQQVHRKKFYGIDVDRQRIIGHYIVDFYIPSLSLVIEIDGQSHAHQGAYDEVRQSFLTSLGLLVYRVKDEDVKADLAGLMLRLEDFIVQAYGFEQHPDRCAPTPLSRGESEAASVSSIGFDILYFDSLDSTNKEALRQAAAGAKEGLVIVAKTQTAGKGRLGRKWHTIDHALAMTVLLRPALKPMDVPMLSLVTAVALHEALLTICPNIAPDIGIKWPNDLWIHGKKVSGILTEMRCQGDNVQAVILGMGINISAPKHGWADDITHPAIDLQSASGLAVTKEEVMQAVLNALDTWYSCFQQHGFAPIRQAWWAAHVASGKHVSVHDGEHYIQGIAHALAEDGALCLLVNGVEQRIIAGDVSIMAEQQ